MEEAQLRALAAMLRRVAGTDEPLSLRTRADLDVHARLLDSLLGSTAPSSGPTVNVAAATERPDWHGTARQRPNGPDGLQHAIIASGDSACGLPGGALVVWRHQFHGSRLDACPACVSALRLRR